jgi:GAF domain-containing protein
MLELTDLLQREQTLGTSLAQLAEVAVSSVPGCGAASIALSVEGVAATAAISARVALELDLVQYATGDGPCLRSLARAETIRVDIVEADDELPHFAAGARLRGVRSVLSVPAVLDEQPVGTLNLYSFGGPFDDEGTGAARVLATQVAIAISRSPELVLAQRVADEAQEEAEDAAEVSLATGLLMANEACTRQQAEGLLHSAADRDERSVVQIARRIIAEQQRRL